MSVPLSLSARRVWIEIWFTVRWESVYPSLSARRVWIEISMTEDGVLTCTGHSLRGECGLKLLEPAARVSALLSLSARRVWIEIPLQLLQ